MTFPAVPESAQVDATPPDAPTQSAVPSEASSAAAPPGAVPEIGGRRDGTDPTRFGDWEKHGRCVDF